MSPRCPLTILALAAAIACGTAQEPKPAEAAPQPRPSAETGSIEVRVTWEGDPLPESPPFVVPDDFQKRRPEEGVFCGECAGRGVLRHEELEVDARTRGIRNVAAAIAGLPGDPSSLPKAVLDNKDCRFEPRVQFVAVGATLGVRNSDTFTHNARILGRGSQEFWNAIIAPGTESPTRPFVVAGTYTAVCDVHPWMKATVIATKHPYCAITGVDGIAVIDKVPAGQEWEVTLWHETLGTARAKIAVEAGKRASWPVTPRRFKAR